MPTSITVAPGFTQSPFTISGGPTAATRMSAPRQTAGRSLVRLWAIVTVQLSASRGWAIGLPTMRSEEHTSELQSLMRISYAVFCLKKKRIKKAQLQHKRKQRCCRYHIMKSKVY